MSTNTKRVAARDDLVVLEGFHLGDDRIEPGDDLPKLTKEQKIFLVEQGAIGPAPKKAKAAKSKDGDA